MKKCKHCQSEIDKKARICPNCKKRQRGLIATIIMFFGILMLIGGVASLLGESDLQSEIQKQQQEKYSFVEEAKIIEEGNEYFKMKYIVGTIKNTTNKKTSYVQIVFNLYDKDGNVIGSSMDNINHIEPDGTWKFKALITIDEFDTFKFESISGF